MRALDTPRHAVPAHRAAVAIALLLAVAVPAPLRAQRDTTRIPAHPVEDFLHTTSFVGASFSPDGRKLLVSSNESGVYNAMVVPVAGGPPVPLTTSRTNAIFARAFFPRDERILYSSDSGGNELAHLYVRAPDGTVRDLTPGARLQANFVGWAGDDRGFWFTTNQRDPRYFDLYEMAADGYARTLLFRNDSGFDVAAVSPNRRWVALVRNRSTVDTDIYLHDLTTNRLRLLTGHTGSVQNYPQAFTPDGRSLYVTTDEGREFLHLARIDLATGRRTTVLEPSWDVDFARLSRSGKYLAVGVNADARTELKVYEAATMRPVPLPTMPQGEITAITFARNDSVAAFFAGDSRNPRDLFAIGLAGGAQGAAPRRLTHALDAALDPAHLVDAEVVRFASYDGVRIPGLLYRPHGASDSAKVPALVFVHGGPGGQSRVGYDPLVQYLVNHGYAVFAINNRGSSGYGKAFFAMDDRRHGEADLDDVVASRRMLAATGWVDPSRIGVMGGSYGGYMVLAALAFRPDSFQAGVDLFGVANWLRTLRSVPPYWESFRAALYREMGDPATDSVRLRAISPLFHAERIRQPLMVLQGANDPRVLKVESDEIVAAVRQNGVPVEYVVFPDEGHGFLRTENRIRGYKAVLDFLDQHLRNRRVAER